MGTSTKRGPKQAHWYDHPCTSTCSTGPRMTIRAWNRCVANWNRCHTISTRPSHNKTRWHPKTRTKTTSWISFPEIHPNWTKLPYLWLGILRSYARTTLLVSSSQRNNHTHPSLHWSCQPSLLPGTQKNRPLRCWIPTGKGAVQHHFGIQTWH